MYQTCPNSGSSLCNLSLIYVLNRVLLDGYHCINDRMQVHMIFHSCFTDEAFFQYQ
jgi:hypothetical protein